MKPFHVLLAFSDSSKDSLQSDTSIESEDSFASVIFIPKPDKPQNNDYVIATTRTPSVPTSPQVMPCPPTPAHSPAPPRCKIQQQTLVPEVTRFPFENVQFQKSDPLAESRLTTKQSPPVQLNRTPKSVVTVETKTERITKQVVKNLPQIPKFRKHFSINYPIVRRPTAAPALPKMCSMEIFNPETDDLDSDSSEPSSPDSVDSVISAFKQTIDTSTRSTSTDASSANTGKSSAEDPDHIPEDHAKSSLLVNDLDGTKQDPPQPPYQTLSDNEFDRLQQNGESHVSQKDLVDFAEKLSAQLMKEIDKTRPDADDTSALLITDPDDDDQEPFPFRMEDPYIRKLNGEIKNIQSIREELRERRLMLANLNIQHYQSSSTIHEEDESPRDEAEPRNADPTEQLKSVDEKHHHRTQFGATHRTDSVEGESIQDDISGIINSNDNLYVLDAAEIRTASSSAHAIRHPFHSQLSSTARDSSGPHPATGSFESRPSTESWAHSNSTASLDSPSAGGSSTHHRYYHVFREGELDALINHHVTSLHIVSSYYERASWCIVAEKVQVWTI